jgi:hypothetical protein
MTFRAAIPEAMEAIVSRFNCVEIDEGAAKGPAIKSMPEHFELRLLAHCESVLGTTVLLILWIAVHKFYYLAFACGVA